MAEPFTFIYTYSLILVNDLLDVNSARVTLVLGTIVTLVLFIMSLVER